MSETGISEEFAEQLVSTCRTAVGDAVRSVIYFTADEFDLLYLRTDLYGGDRERARAAKKKLVENERLGFTTQETYNETADAPGVEPDIGEYEFTIRVFSEGFISRVLVGDRGILLTTDGIDIDAFEDMAVALRRLLAEQ